MAHIVEGQLGKIFVLHLEPEEDLRVAIETAVRERDIQTGLILDITGTLIQARVQKFQRVGPWREVPMEVVEIAGPLEASGQGILGRVRGSGGLHGYQDGDPFVHCHVTLTSAEQTICGHLMRGSHVRSHEPRSHFSVVLATLEGVRLAVVAEDGSGIRVASGPGWMSGGMHYEVEQTE